MRADQISQIWISFTKTAYGRFLAIDMSSRHSIYTIYASRLRISTAVHSIPASFLQSTSSFPSRTCQAQCVQWRSVSTNSDKRQALERSLVLEMVYTECIELISTARLRSYVTFVNEIHNWLIWSPHIFRVIKFSELLYDCSRYAQPRCIYGTYRVYRAHINSEAAVICYFCEWNS